MRSSSIGYQCPSCASDSTPVIKGINKNRFIPNQKNTQVTKFLSISLIVVYVAQFLLGDILIANFALFAPSVENGKWKMVVVNNSRFLARINNSLTI
jgi:hypothetical protein